MQRFELLKGFGELVSEAELLQRRERVFDDIMTATVAPSGATTMRLQHTSQPQTLHCYYHLSNIICTAAQCTPHSNPLYCTTLHSPVLNVQCSVVANVYLVEWGAGNSVISVRPAD